VKDIRSGQTVRQIVASTSDVFDTENICVTRINSARRFCLSVSIALAPSIPFLIPSLATQSLRPPVALLRSLTAAVAR